MAAIKAQHTANEIGSEFGVHVSQVNKWKKQVVDAVPDIFGDTSAKALKTMEAERDRLYLQIGKLQVQLEWLKKKDRTSVMSVSEKRACIEADHKSLSIQQQCELVYSGPRTLFPFAFC